MARKSLMPFSGNRAPARRTEAQQMGDWDPFPVFRREMNRLFEDFFGGFGMPMLGGADGERMLTPQIDVSETDKEIQIAAELPGLEEKDVDVTLADDLLTIRGEKKDEREQKDRNYHLVERMHGTFARTIRLPFSVDAAQAQAVFKDGVLRITIPKPKEVQQKTRKIEVKKDQGAGRAASQQASRTQSGSDQKVPETAAE